MFGILSGGTGSSKTDLVMHVKNQCDDYIKAQSKSLSREKRVWDVYKALYGSQYADKKLRVFKEEEREPWQFDFVSPKIDTLAGAVVSELPDPDWVPVIGEPNILTEAVRESYISDKDLFNYVFTLIQIIRDGCVKSGWGELCISKEYHPAGNINLRRLRPRYFIPSPYWQSSYVKDLEVAYKLGYYNAAQMKQKWKAKSDEIDRALYELKQGRYHLPPNDITTKQHNYESQVGDEWLVREKRYLEIQNTVRLVGLPSGTDRSSDILNWISFPVTERRELLEKFAQDNDIDWTTVQELPFERKIHKVITVSDIAEDLILYEGKGSVQCNSLPFLHYTTTRVDGIDKGIAESLIDLQTMFNERMSHVHQMIAKASGGSTLVNEELFPDPKKRQQHVKGRNKPGHVDFVQLDEVKTPKIDEQPLQVNPAIFQQVSIIYNELLPIISRVSDTMSAVSNSEDTGVLFEKKYQMNKVANVLFEKFAKQLINDLGEKYFYQWQQTYGSTRREVKRKGGGVIILNKDMGDSVMNDVSLTPRCKVVVTENFASPTYQLRQRMQIQEIIKAIPEDDYLRLNQALGIYFNSIPMDEENKALMEQATVQNNIRAQMRFMTEMSTFKAQIGNNQVMVKQAEQMLQGMTMPQEGQTAFPNRSNGMPAEDMVTPKRVSNFQQQGAVENTPEQGSIE